MMVRPNNECMYIQSRTEPKVSILLKKAANCVEEHKVANSTKVLYSRKFSDGNIFGQSRISTFGTDFICVQCFMLNARRPCAKSYENRFCPKIFCYTVCCKKCFGVDLMIIVVTGCVSSIKGCVFTGMIFTFTFLFFYRIIFSRNMLVNELYYGTPQPCSCHIEHRGKSRR